MLCFGKVHTAPPGNPYKNIKYSKYLNLLVYKKMKTRNDRDCSVEARPEYSALVDKLFGEEED